MIKFNSILKFIIHLCSIYINPMLTVYLIKGFGVETLASALTLNKCCWVAKFRETLLQKMNLYQQYILIYIQYQMF
jgi:hypothetical protein